MDDFKQMWERITWWHWLAAAMIMAVLLSTTWALAR